MTPMVTSKRAPSALTLKPDAFIAKFKRDVKTKIWPAWVLVRWEEAFLLRRFLRMIWEILQAGDPSADRIVLHPRDASSAEQVFEEISAPSLFASTRLVIVHVARPVKRAIPLDKLATHLAVVPDRTLFVLVIEEMWPVADELAALSKSNAASDRPGCDIQVWRPYHRGDYMTLAREDILRPAGVQCDPETLSFWLDRIGLNLDRLEAEAKRMKIQFPDGEVTSERLEQVFEVPHVHEETLWQALDAILSGRPGQASAALQSLLQSMDVYVAMVELTQTILCVNEIAAAGAAHAPKEDVFRKMGIKGKRRQGKILNLATRLAGPIPNLAPRLLALDIAVKQTRTVAARQEVFLRTFLSLGGEPEPAA